MYLLTTDLHRLKELFYNLWFKKILETGTYLPAHLTNEVNENKHKLI